jgi:hypothetical protein
MAEGATRLRVITSVRHKRLKHVKMAGHPRMSVPRQINRRDGLGQLNALSSPRHFVDGCSVISLNFSPWVFHLVGYNYTKYEKEEMSLYRNYIYIYDEFHMATHLRPFKLIGLTKQFGQSIVTTYI